MLLVLKVWLQTQVKVKQWRVGLLYKMCKEVRGFSWLTGCWRKFIEHYDLISKPLSELLKKGVPFVWTTITKDAFQIGHSLQPRSCLYQTLTSLLIEAYACDIGIGVVLMQYGIPLAYVNKSLAHKNIALSVHNEEYMAILLAMEQWRAFLRIQNFAIKTNHKSLVHLKNQKIRTTWQHMALTKLMRLNYQIVLKRVLKISS